MGLRLLLSHVLARATFALLAAFALAGASGCGRSPLLDLGDDYDAGPGPDGATPCNAVTCPTGCCEGATGPCVEGTFSAACGTSGASCVSCSAGTSCDLTQRACVAAPVEAGTCSELTCPSGCCDDTGACHPGTDPGLCGSFGNACVDCEISGMTCDTNLQQCAATACGSECKGCCENGACVPGTQDSACGTGGTTCTSCTNRGQSCAIDPFGGGLCEAPGCNATTCAGCCSAGGCVLGTVPSACGNEGDACVTCAAAGEQCVALPGTAGGGLCTTTACSSVSCFGCCDASGLCRTGTSANACGTDGATCALCNGGNTCVDGECQQAASCGPSTCVGCCDGTGTCVAGSDGTACGAGGEACMPCGTGAACIGNVCVTSGACNATNCNGCCSGNQCLDGTSDGACGTLGVACSVCSGGANCSSGQCLTAPCGPDNCGGCCDASNSCVTGDTNGVCGSFGVACAACGAGTQCVDGFCDPTCGPGTCSGCCVGGVCAIGTQNAACGGGGADCVSCSGGQVCGDNACVTPAACGPSNCTGCCDQTGTCEAGFLDAACGSGGAACIDCVNGATCDVNGAPRLCSGQSGTCPAPFPACPSGATLPVASTQNVCTAQDLSQVGQACSGGATTSGCQSFFVTEKSINAGCAACLAPFDVPFAAETGVLLCAAPFLTTACTAAGACFESCESATCGQCAAGSATTTCQNDAESGACNTWYSQLGCATSGVSSGGQFCDPSGYATFGAWIQAVGGHYCAN